MKLENSIGWCDVTGNKVIGCDKVSPGCKNCYAEVGTVARVMRHRAVNPVETWGPHGTRIAVADFTAKLRRLNKLCICDGCHETYPVEWLSRPNTHCTNLAGDFCGIFRRIRFFADSNSDWLDDKWPVETFVEFLREIHSAPNVDVILLTKRIENWNPKDSLPPNVWPGVSVENQAMADQRIRAVLEIPAAVRLLSVEPLLEGIDLSLGLLNTTRLDLTGIDWVIVGGESGPARRDCGVEAIVSVAEQCVAARVPVYVKQDCAAKAGQQGRIPDEIWKLKQFPNTSGREGTAVKIEIAQ